MQLLNQFSINRRLRSSTFTPLTLFSSNEPGAWFDPSDLSTLYQDSAGTTPVTAAGQPVGRVLDKSGRGNHASQPVASRRPTLIQDENGKYCLSFDDVDDFLVTPVITPGIDKAQVFAGVRKLGDAGVGVIAELSTNSSRNGGVGLTANGWFGPVGARYGAASRDTTGSTYVGGDTAALFTSPVSNVLATRHDLAGGANASVLQMRANGADLTLTYGASAFGGGSFPSQPLYIGCRGGNSLFFNGNIYSLITRFGPNLDEATIAKTEAWLAAKTGVTI